MDVKAVERCDEFSQENLRPKMIFPLRVEGDDERKQLSADNFPLKSVTDSSDIARN